MKVRQRDIEQTDRLQAYLERELFHRGAHVAGNARRGAGSSDSAAASVRTPRRAHSAAHGIVFGLLSSAFIVAMFLLVGMVVRGWML